MKPAVPLLGLLLLTGSCDDMTDQPKASRYSAAATAVAAAEGAVVYHATEDAAPPLTLALLQRGQQRFHIYCAPCHSELGDGNGMVVQRGFPTPPSYHSDRLRAASTEHFFDVITHGYGAMYAFSDRIQSADRWAIAAYIRALQLSQHAPGPQ